MIFREGNIVGIAKWGQVDVVKVTTCANLSNLDRMRNRLAIYSEANLAWQVHQIYERGI